MSFNRVQFTVKPTSISLANKIQQNNKQKQYNLAVFDFIGSHLGNVKKANYDITVEGPVYCEVR